MNKSRLTHKISRAALLLVLALCSTTAWATITGGGTVTANGGYESAGIGIGYWASCGNITISGGTVNATGGAYAPGIGSSDYLSSCGDITITNGVTMVTATAGQNCSNAIGAGDAGSCQTVTIGGVETGFITQSPFTTYPYTLAFNANGGTGTMDDASFMYNVAQNLPNNGFSPAVWGQTFDGWATSPDGEKVYDNGQSVSNLTKTPGDIVTLYAKWVTSISAVGNEYTIHTATGWNLFCDMLTESNDYLSGSTVKLGADLIVTRLADKFKGSFNGQGHTLTVNYSSGAQVTAPFCYVDGATITNLVTAGTISTTKKFAAGMIGKTEGGAVSITNCASNVTINSSVSGDGTHGGFVGLANGGTLNITGCTFGGQMLGANTTNCGGFVGWTESNNNVTTTITDCLFAPTNLEIHSGYTFSRARNMNSVTITNCYYTEPLGTAQGHPAVSDPAIQPAGNPTATYNVSGITTYANGMLYGETFYYNPDMITYIGSGDGISSYLPLNNYFNYSLTEQIYTAEELGETGVIEGIGFFKNSNKSCERDIVIYMVHTDKDEFESTSDWITVTENDRVFSGTVNFDDYSWTYITLDEVFVYDGLHNVVIVVDDNTGGYNSTTYFSTFPTEEAGQALFQYSDGTNFDPMGTLADSRDVLNQKNQLCIFKSELGDCMKTSRLTATEVGPDLIVLDWNEFGASENWLVRYNGAFVEASEHPFTLTGLEPETEYTIAVSPICDTSLWSRSLTLTTLVACPAPFNVEVDDITQNSATVTWTGYSESYIVHYRTASVIADTLLNEGFEGGIMPVGWAVEGDTQDTTKTWRVGVGDSNLSTGTHSGEYNALITHATDGNVTYLITPAMNLSGLSNLKLSLWYINRIWSGDIDGFAVCYREGDNGDWIELWSTTEDHATWTFLTISLTGLPDNCQIGFRMTDGYGRGVGLDDILIGIEQIGEWETLTTTATSKTLIGLIPETEYEVYVNPYCDETAVSGTVSFTTSIQTVFTFTKDIEGYGYEANLGGWFLIASPVVEAIAPSEENGFLTNEYDLYYFNQSIVGEEWRNYEDDNFLLTNGTGYLYASEIATTLIFTGTPYTGNGEIELAYNPNVPDFAGWNLVGNPFAETAYVDRDFYTMNNDGSEIIASTSSTVEAMEGIFVVADYDGETMTFAPATREANPEERIVLNLTRSNSTVIDRAIVRFGEGKQLPKFQLDPSHTKVYLPMDGKDYAVVRSESMGEMPVNFKAEHNGTYTLTFSTENLDLGYLHLIDNLTSADVDLLVPEPVEGPASYTFTAKTTDYESRFKLVFVCGDANDDNEAFAFVNNGNIVINGEGTLQVIDMMGRVIVCTDVARNVSTQGMTPGVYILRLIDGDNVKTQKIVIE